jgi:hypothetical protein
LPVSERTALGLVALALVAANAYAIKRLLDLVGEPVTVRYTQADEAEGIPISMN